MIEDAIAGIVILGIGIVCLVLLVRAGILRMPTKGDILRRAKDPRLPLDRGLAKERYWPAIKRKSRKR